MRQTTRFLYSLSIPPLILALLASMLVACDDSEEDETTKHSTTTEQQTTTTISDDVDGNSNLSVITTHVENGELVPIDMAL